MANRLFQASAFTKYLVKSKKGTLVHSPFVYDLALKVLYKKEPKDAYTSIRKYRKILKTNKTDFSKIDLGTGNARRENVAQLAKTSSIRHKYGMLLHRLVSYQKPKHVLELGTCLGVSAAYLSLNGNPITTVEGCQNTMRVAQNSFQSHFTLHNCSFIQSDFETFLKTNKGYDLVFLDGHHAYAPTLNYFKKLWQNLPENGLIILDDIHWSEEMEKAWGEITLQTENLVSIDLFQLGLCFKRTEQVKEHFILRV